MNIYFKQSQEFNQQIHNLIIQLVKPIQPMTLQKYIDLSTIKPHNKKYLKSLFNKYVEYCRKDLNYSDYQVIDNCPLDLNFDIYNPDNVIKFMNEKCNFKRTSIKKIRDIFLRAIRKCTRNPSLEYTVPLGLNDAPYLKHYIKYNELKNFLIYLKKKGNIGRIPNVQFPFVQIFFKNIGKSQIYLIKKNLNKWKCSKNSKKKLNVQNVQIFI